MPGLKEQHFHCGWNDRTFVQVDHYDPHHGLNLRYFWQKILFKDTANSPDIEAARMEAARTFLSLGGKVVISILDSLAIPENDRNSPIDMREGTLPIGIDETGHNIYPKVKTGNSGIQYYDWQPFEEIDLGKLLYTAEKSLHEQPYKLPSKRK